MDKKVLVEMYFTTDDSNYPVVICDTMEEAKEWIEKRMEGKVYNGLGYYRPAEVDYYKKGDKEHE